MRFKILIFLAVFSTLPHVAVANSNTVWEFSQQGEDFCMLDAKSSGVKLRIWYEPATPMKRYNSTLMEIVRPSLIRNWINSEIKWPPRDEFDNFGDENAYFAIFEGDRSIKMMLPFYSNYGEEVQTHLGESQSLIQRFTKKLASSKVVSIYMEHSSTDGFRVTRLGRWTSYGSRENETTIGKFQNCILGK